YRIARGQRGRLRLGQARGRGPVPFQRGRRLEGVAGILHHGSLPGTRPVEVADRDRHSHGRLTGGVGDGEPQTNELAPYLPPWEPRGSPYAYIKIVERRSRSVSATGCCRYDRD
ncbi:MAG: hypothetical protein ACK55I_41105, partial [bacterium]